MTSSSDTLEEALDDYCQVRFHAARKVGLMKVEADRFARGQATLQTLRKLERDGCPARTIARIVC